MKPVQIALMGDNPGDVLLVEMALKENGTSCQLTRFENGAEALRVLCAPAEANALVPDASQASQQLSRRFRATRAGTALEALCATRFTAIITSRLPAV